ncbi:hypothetical protein BWR59_12780 [Pseudomonas sp. Bc-h]|jgi:hypothetical protein|uniref:hypothetical protein n=1 Tax=Pseudomonas sp. Bc-h TaxID=1943632 RepID=UPI0009DA4301|nr:hypothetical protein [Pseudomonas sp. Bc-h]OQR32820.1 hypothetical protein BWR59_12780 [Pseudomonas sp. Bc-h]
MTLSSDRESEKSETIPAELLKYPQMVVSYRTLETTPMKLRVRVKGLTDKDEIHFHYLMPRGKPIPPPVSPGIKVKPGHDYQEVEFHPMSASNWKNVTIGLKYKIRNPEGKETFAEQWLAVHFVE